MKYIVIGAVAGGASAAARLRRLDETADIVIFEKGEYISYANCGLPYYIGNVINDRNKLFVQTAAAFNKRFNIDVRVRTEVIAIDTVSKKVKALNHADGREYEESYDKLVLSTGAEPLRPLLPGIDLPGIFTLRNVADTDHIKSYADSIKTGTAVIVGGGFIGLEMAENLHVLGMKVFIVEMGAQILPPADMPVAAIAQGHIRSKGIELRLNTIVSGFEQKDGHLNVLLENGNNIAANIVILSMGVKPDTKLAASAGLQLGKTRGIQVNEFLQTSDPDIYALGDAIEFANPQTGTPMNTYLAGPANKQGRICADNIARGNKKAYKGSINTAIVKIFDMTVAVAGFASKHLTAMNIEHIVSTTHSGSHAGYYPNSKQMTIQISFSPDTGILHGAQVVGYDGVDKRIDILSSIIKSKGSIFDLKEFEHAYAPPFSSAKDPVNMAGFVAENIIAGYSNIIYWNDISALDKSDMMVDVRTPAEFAMGTIPGSVNIPLDELRGRLNELPFDCKIIVFCQVGLRGYLAERILAQNGYLTVFNLSGGYRLWSAVMEERRVQELC